MSLFFRENDEHVAAVVAEEAAAAAQLVIKPTSTVAPGASAGVPNERSIYRYMYRNRSSKRPL